MCVGRGERIRKHNQEKVNMRGGLRKGVIKEITGAHMGKEKEGLVGG